jgi:hypothetical protein
MSGSRRLNFVAPPAAHGRPLHRAAVGLPWPLPLGAKKRASFPPPPLPISAGSKAPAPRCPPPCMKRAAGILGRPSAQ